MCLERDNSAGTCVFGPLNIFRSLPEASSTHSATAQQSPQGSSMKGLCAVVGIGTTAVLHSVLNTRTVAEHCFNNFVPLI